MTDIVHLYSKSNKECKNIYEVPQTGIRSNLSQYGCQISPYFDCYNTVVLSQSNQPISEKPIIKTLNPELYMNKYDKGFYKVKGQAGCNKDVYMSYDPRGYSASHVQRTYVDEPPINGKVALKNIYAKNFENYGQGMSDYSDIKDGQITYYYDESTKDAFYKPVYSEEAIETTVLYQDPMSSMKPEHNRTAIMNIENPTTSMPTGYPYCLSYIQDTQSFREDLIALQQRKNNQSKWTARWIEK
jgi:hypothetical protein